MDMSAWEVRGRLGQRDGGHVVCLQFVPMRNVVQQSRLQLNQDLSEGTVTDESNKRVDWKHFQVFHQYSGGKYTELSSHATVKDSSR